MTLARLQHVADIIEENGWKIVTPRSKLFEVMQETIEWEIERGEAEKRVVIFRLVDYLGRRTEKLSDIFSFQVTGIDKEVYFKKVNSKAWGEALQIMSSLLK